VRSDFRPDSDIDVIIDTKPGIPARLATLLAVEQLLERAFGRDVDVVTPGALDDAVRGQVDREGVAIHG
jgi:predicted nucleotidyltransferase